VLEQRAELRPATSRARAEAFDDRLDGLGYDFFTGVPCSLLGRLYDVLGERGRAYFPATREDLALGLAAGAAMAGRRAAVLMQNSGLGVSVNALLTLHAMYELPVLLVVTWRGHGPDAPEHVEMGRLVRGLLADVSIPSRLLDDPDAFDPDLHTRHAPVALLVRPGELAG
jgi:sulfopyruvate decarboxylase subunit alpha